MAAISFVKDPCADIAYPLSPAASARPTATLMRGTWYVLPTAFSDNGILDLVGQRRLVESTLSWGVDGLTVMAIMSEAATLTDEERTMALDVIFSVVHGRVPVAVGCSGPTTSVVIRRMKAAAHLGARAAMISAPMLTSDLDSLPSFSKRLGSREISRS